MRTITAQEAIEIVEKTYKRKIEVVGVQENNEYFCVGEEDYGQDDDSYTFVNKRTREVEIMLMYETDELWDVPEGEWK